MARRSLVAGNWKMNGLRAARGELDAMIAGASAAPCDLLVCPPFTLVGAFADAVAGSGLRIGAQTCHPKSSGAHTGDISAEMLSDAGASAVIVGHSERRADHRETDEDVRAQAEAAWRAGLAAVLCVGETEAERDAGDTLQVIGASLRDSVPDGATAERLVIAYEPVWAIGTGRTPTLEQIDEVHAFLRAELAERFGAEIADGIRLLYGGSVKPDNAEAIFAVADVDGALVGGASLTARDFLAIAYSV
ncbi:MAG: triose-phosphate isomerase [Rubrimonas sp.]|uniref:triose-phosphate isomerase n=1 Tax=Rubrimonas sp. TaxID=2036015 RepID=UPI002FDCD827